MITLHEGCLRLADGAFGNAVSLHYWVNDAWHPLPLAAQDEEYVGQDGPVTARLRLAEDSDGAAYTLSFTAGVLTRLQLRLSAPSASPFHLIPALIFGDNNLSHAEPGHFPNLTHTHAGNVSCAPYWEFRADRASHPVSLLCVEGAVLAVSIAPYTEASPVNPAADAFVRNGLFAELGQGDQAPACGATLGYRNTPVTFINKDQWGDSTEHLAVEGTVRGRLFVLPAADRQAVHRVIRRVYADYRDTPATPITAREAVAALTDAFLHVNWEEARENFTNMTTRALTVPLAPWRTLAEVGWTGGGVIGYPLLVAGTVLGDAEALKRAHYKLDWVANAYNPDSGLLWDVCGKHEGTQVNWWWSGYIVQDCHCAYTNGSGVYYLLKAYHYCAARGEAHPAWLETACKVLDTLCALQLPDGNFGYSYRTDRPEMLDREGFAGVWFVPAMVYAYRATGHAAYLDAARRGLEYYAAFVHELNCWGTPMDTWKSLDEEGVLGFIRGAQLLHETTGEPRFLALLAEGADYEFLWRYGFRARPECPPLRGSHWNSCGGSVTSVSNPHIHPMGIFIASELRYLAEQTGDPYYRARFEDGCHWGINSVALYPEVAGYGIRGVLTERFCPSDGLTIELYPDGTPSSIWFSYNGWSAAAVLEGLVEQM